MNRKKVRVCRLCATATCVRASMLFGTVNGSPWRLRADSRYPAGVVKLWIAKRSAPTAPASLTRASCLTTSALSAMDSFLRCVQQRASDAAPQRERIAPRARFQRRTPGSALALVRNAAAPSVSAQAPTAARKPLEVRPPAPKMTQPAAMKESHVLLHLPSSLSGQPLSK